MKFYYIMQDDKIFVSDFIRKRLEDTIHFLSDLRDKENVEILETEQEIENNMFVGSDEWKEYKAKEVRALRNSYLESVIDVIVSNPLRWDEMSQDEKQTYIDYRNYLRGIPQRPLFPDIHIMDLEEYKSHLTGDMLKSPINTYEYDEEDKIYRIRQLENNIAQYLSENVDDSRDNEEQD